MVLITGANGFIGRSLSDQLNARGFAVRVAMRRKCSFDKCNDLEHVVVGDIGPNTNWENALAGIDCVVHLAARVHVMADNINEPLAEFLRVNRDGTLRLAEQAALYGVKRFVYLSSIKVNGEETVAHPFTAADPPCPLDPYGVSKAEAEEQLFALAKQSDMEVVVIRPPLVYGPGVKANFAKMMQFVAKGVPLPLGAIKNKRSLVALENLVDLIITCIAHPSAANQIFLAGDGEDLSTTDLLKRLGGALGKSACLVPVPQWLLEASLKILGKGDIAQRLCGSLQVDISKAHDLLGWKPPFNIDAGLKKTADYFLGLKTYSK